VDAIIAHYLVFLRSSKLYSLNYRICINIVVREVHSEHGQAVAFRKLGIVAKKTGLVGRGCGMDVRGDICHRVTIRAKFHSYELAWGTWSLDVDDYMVEEGASGGEKGLVLWRA